MGARSTPSRVLRVVVADDSYLVRVALGHLLDTDPRVELVASCGDAAELAEVVARELPDVVVTDIRMPPDGGDDGIAFANRLRDTHPEIGVVIISQYADSQYGLALLRRGSARRAYLLKDRLHEREPLIEAIHAVAREDSVVDPKIVEALVEARARGLGELTPRERQILRRMAAGDSNRAIAGHLALTKKSVERHIHAIFAKLRLVESEDVSRRVKAALIYLGAVTDEPPPP